MLTGLSVLTIMMVSCEEIVRGPETFAGSVSGEYKVAFLAVDFEIFGKAGMLDVKLDTVSYIDKTILVEETETESELMITNFIPETEISIPGENAPLSFDTIVVEIDSTGRCKINEPYPEVQYLGGYVLEFIFPDSLSAEISTGLPSVGTVYSLHGKKQ